MDLRAYAKLGGGTIGEVILLPPSIIKVDPNFNPRLQSDALDQHIREIADSIKADGFDRTQPLAIRYREDGVWLRDGHCRLRAVNLAISEGTEIERLPCLQMRGATEADDSYIVLTTQKKKPLEPVEYAMMIRRLLRLGQTETEIARRLGKRRDFVEGMLNLAEAPDEVKDSIVNYGLSATSAMKFVRADGAEDTLDRAAEAATARGSKKVKPRDIATATNARHHDIAAIARTLACEWLDCPPVSIPDPLRSALNQLADAFPQLRRRAAA